MTSNTGSSLRRRIMAAYVALALGLCGCFAVVVDYARGEIDKYLVQHRLDLVVRWRLAGAQPSDSASLTPEIAFYRGAGMPPWLRGLKPGFQEVHDGDRKLDALIGVLPSGEFYAAVDLVSDFERIEGRVLLGLSLGIVGAALLALLLGRATAGRVLAPVVELADAVGGHRLTPDSPLLTRDDEIGVLARALARNNAELQRYLQRERLFTGDVSHELRTPLTVILGAAEVLAVQLPPEAPQQAAVERIRRTARSTAERVAALLLLSRSPENLAAPRLELAPLIEREAERCADLLAGKPVRLVLQLDTPTHVYAPPELVEMAVGNLLRNACQYTEDGEIIVNLTSQGLQVSDTGPGLPPDVQAQLFERLPSGSRSGGGSGLGLALVKRIAEHLGWTIEHSQLQGRGSRFTLVFTRS
ncbi:sensor histidine kinase [Burkholderiaceae bacterium UC74_6]